MRTKLLQLSNRLQALLVEQRVSGQLLTYMEDYILILGKGNQQGLESFRWTGVKSACGWKGRLHTALLQEERWG